MSLVFSKFYEIARLEAIVSGNFRTGIHIMAYYAIR
jgi:hypothetical protein